MNKTKTKILKIAIKMFKNSSYDDVTINDICKKSDISKHTFYYYFKSKEDLIRESVTNFKDLESIMFKEIALLNNPLDKYLLFSTKRASMLYELGPDLCKMLLQMDFEGGYNCTIDQETKDKIKNFSKMRVEFLRLSQEAGLVKNMTDPNKLTHYHSALTYGIIQRWAISHHNIQLKETIEEASKSLLNYE
jgi:AcrR family transcriptional regulator